MTSVFLQLPITVRAFGPRSRFGLSVGSTFRIGVPHEPCRRQDLLCPLLTSAPRSACLSASSAAYAARSRSPGVSSAAFRAQSPDLRSACLMDMDFTVSRPLVPRSRLVSGFYPLTRAFALRFLQTPPRGGSPCVFANPSPPSGRVEDFHFRAAEHARHTTKSAARIDEERCIEDGVNS